jgi:hypothetical protein
VRRKKDDDDEAGVKRLVFENSRIRVVYHSRLDMQHVATYIVEESSEDAMGQRFWKQRIQVSHDDDQTVVPELCRALDEKRKER